MSKKITPYFLFDGTCADAMRFYQSAFGGKLTIVKAGDSPMKAQFPPQLHKRVIQARLQSDGIDISASDWFHPTQKPDQGNTDCAYISGTTYEELKRYFDRLSEDADPSLLEAPHSMPFGTYGALTDKYGKRWMFQSDEVAGKS